MEVKVLVDGLPRVVCGVTAETTCHDVVIALAQAMGRPGRYRVQEKFKDFERCMAPDERPLETLKKYGEQARDVRLTLLHNGSSADVGRAKGGRYQPGPPLRRKDASVRAWRGSGSACLQRQSLPSLSCSKQDAEHQRKEELKRPKRKSLTLMEEAWEWLESLGKGKVYSTARGKDSGKKADKRNRNPLGISLTADEGDAGNGISSRSKSKVRGRKSVKSDLDRQTSCCIGNETWGKGSKRLEEKPKVLPGSNDATKDEKTGLSETIIHQVSRLQDLQVQIAHVERLVSELEERKGVKQAQQRMIEEETEQIKFWENELKAEEAYEKQLQRQFLQMRENALGCKAKLEDYKRKMQGLDFCTAQNAAEQDSDVGANFTAKPTEGRQPDPDREVDVSRKFPPGEDLNAGGRAGQIKERRPTGPTELREWWTRWARAQGPQLLTKEAVTHRSELTIYLGGKKV